MSKVQQNIKVAVRLRPYNRREHESNQRCIIKVMDRTTLLFDPDEEDDEFFFQGTKHHYRDITKRVNKKLSMEFDRVFDMDVGNVQIFEECTLPLVDTVLQGYNCSVFVYGATGAGKTFTMLGSETSPGLMFLTMRYLFEKMDSQQDLRKFDVGVSYLEVYNEQVMNLLTKSAPLKLLEDSNGVVVSGLVLKPIHNAAQLLELLTLGNANRTQHPTDANAESSRSHAIFQVHIRITDRKTGTKRTTKLSMIDLAGSERAAATKELGLRFKEGASINKSLLALGNCINKLADGLKHIPYRDSNLTRILKDSLGGNCQTLMVANVSRSSLTYEDTYNTLNYALRAKKIRTTLKQNVLRSNMPVDFYVKKVDELMSETRQLKENIKSLENKLELQEKAAAKTSGYNQTELKPWFCKIDLVYSHFIKTKEYVIGLQSKLKGLILRSKLKEEAEALKKILTLNDAHTIKESLSKFDASMSCDNNEIEKQREELGRWRIKLDAAYKEVEKLWKEISTCPYAQVLQIYRKTKDLEIKTSKQAINFMHISGINDALIHSAHAHRKAMVTTLKTLQICYDRLVTTQALSPDMVELFERVQRQINSIAQAQHSDNDAHNVSDEDLKLIQTASLASNKRSEKTYATETYPAKRQRLPRSRLGVRALEMGLEPLESSDSTDYATTPEPNTEPSLPVCLDTNTTFIASSRTSMDLKLNLISNVLSEDLIRPPKRAEQLKSALAKSKTFTHQGLVKTVASANKENKQCCRIRKSPRGNVAQSMANTANLMKKQAARALKNNFLEPAVKMNRAAAMRFKK